MVITVGMSSRIHIIRSLCAPGVVPSLRAGPSAKGQTGAAGLVSAVILNPDRKSLVAPRSSNCIRIAIRFSVTD